MVGPEFQTTKQVTTTNQPIYVEREETLREHLTSLQAWEQTGKKTVADQRSNQKIFNIQQQNLRLYGIMIRDVPKVTANKTAPGTPAPVQTPAKNTIKTKWDQKRKAKEAQKQLPGTDHISYDLQKNMTAGFDQVTNSFKAFGGNEKLQVTGADVRVLRALCTGYQVDRDGNPLNDLEMAKKENDVIALCDYTSKDINRRKPHLDKLVADIRDFTFSTDMFEGVQLVKNIQMLNAMGDKITYFENIFKDPINRPYFDNMDPLEIQAINTKLDKIASAYVCHLGDKCAKKGIFYADFNFFSTPAQFKAASSGGEASAQDLRVALSRAKQVADSHLEQIIAREKEQELETAQEIKTKIQEDEQFANLRGLEVTGFATADSYEILSSSRALIENNQELYQEHQTVADNVYQQIYRCVDVLGDFNLECRSLQRAWDLCRTKEEGSSYYQAFSRKLEERLAPLTEKIEAQQAQIKGLTEALAFYVGDQKLTENAIYSLRYLGYAKQAQEVSNNRTIHKAFHGEAGAVATSNRDYAEAKERGDSKEQTRAIALRSLGLSDESSEATEATKLMAGETLAHISEKVLDFAESYESRGTEDRDMYKVHMLSDTIDDCTTGVEMDEVNWQLMELAYNALNASETVDYLIKMHKNIGGAEVFEGSVNEYVQFMANDLLTKYVANYDTLSDYREHFDQPYDTSKVFKKAFRTILAMPVFLRDQSNLEKQPDHIKNLLRSYNSLIKTLTDKVSPKPQP